MQIIGTERTDTWIPIDFATAEYYNGSAVTLPSGTNLDFSYANQYYSLSFTYGGTCSTTAIGYPSSQSLIGVEGNNGAYMLGADTNQIHEFLNLAAINTNFTNTLNLIVYSGPSTGGSLTIYMSGDVFIQGMVPTMSLIPLPYNIINPI